VNSIRGLAISLFFFPLQFGDNLFFLSRWEHLKESLSKHYKQSRCPFGFILLFIIALGKVPGHVAESVAHNVGKSRVRVMPFSIVKEGYLRDWTCACESVVLVIAQSCDCAYLQLLCEVCVGIT